MNLKLAALVFAAASLIATPVLAQGGGGADNQPVRTSPDTPNAPHNATTYDNSANQAKDEASGQIHSHKKKHHHY